MLRFVIALLFATFLWASVASAQVVDRDMTMEEPTTTELGNPIQNLQDCLVDVVDATNVPENLVIPASAPTGGGTQTIDLTGKIGLTTVTARCRNTIGGESDSVSLSRTFPGDAPANPALRD